MINLDPNIIDQEKVRKNRRRKLFKITIAPIIVLIIAGIIFIRPSIYNIVMRTTYNNSNYKASKTVSDMQKHLNVFEEYLAYYNAGVSDIKNREYEEAERNFADSLEHNPPSIMLCKIYVNYSYSVEMQADKARNAGNYESAIELYNRAESILYSNNCAAQSSDKTGNDEKADKSLERVKEKRTNTAKEMSQSGEDEGNYNPGSSVLDSSDLDRIRENNQNNSDLQRDMRNSAGKRSSGTGGGGGSYSGSSTQHW